MARREHEHLTRDELERLAGPTPVDTVLEPARAHLEACEACQEQVNRYVFERRTLGGTPPGAPPVRGIACPAESDWAKVAANLMSQDETQSRTEHAAACDYCGPRLRQAVEELSAPPTAEEERTVAGLASAKAQWHRRMAQDLSAASAQAGRQAAPTQAASRRWLLGLTPQWALAAAAAVIAVLGGVWWWNNVARSPERLLAEAYTAQRTFELRIPGAAYGPLRQERGAERSRLSKPPELLEAEALIGRKVTSNPNDPRWLAAKGQAELLEWQYAEAIRSFERALDAQPDSPVLLTNLGTAYFQRAETEGRAVDYGSAVEYFGRALAKSPDNQVALFNSAVTKERLLLYHEAIADWEHYLRVDPRGPWAEEAQRRLNGVREKIRTLEKPGARLLPDPAAAAPGLRERADAKKTSLDPWPDSLDEEYLDVAVKEWLPALYSPVSLQRNPAAWDALSALADVLLVHHGDRWLTDVLADSPSRDLAEGFSELAAASKNNAAGNADGARPLAESSARHFRAAGSPAGTLRAQREGIYAMARSQRAQQCLDALKSRPQPAGLASYSWLEIQFSLERLTCLAMLGRIDEAGRAGTDALRYSRRNNYGSLTLRTLSLLGAVETERANPQGAWSWDLMGLREYWKSHYRPLRAYEFYGDMGYSAENAGQWHCALAIAREAVHFSELGPDGLTRALAHHRVAAMSRLAGDLPQFHRELEVFRQLFSALPASPGTRSLFLSAECYVAALEVEKGDLTSAEQRLSRLRQEMPRIENAWLWMTFYKALGELYLRRGDTARSEKSLRAAVFLGESRLAGVRNDADRLNWDREAGRAYRAWVELRLRQQNDATSALELWEWYRGAPLRAGAAPKAANLPFAILEQEPPTIPVESLRNSAAMMRSQTVLTYALLPEGLAIWMYDDRGIQSRWVGVPKESLVTVARRFAEQCSDPKSDVAALRADGRQLYEWLIAPFASKLDPARVLIVEPDGPLGLVPIGALVDPGGDYVADHFAVVISPGLGYARGLRPWLPIRARDNILLVGDAALGKSAAALYPPLPDARQEIQRIGARFEHPIFLTGKEATAQEVLRWFPRVQLFHFAGHAVNDVQGGQLLLAGDDSAGADGLRAAVIPADRLHSLRLVVLSACSTAAGERGLVDPDSLVRVFLRNGVTGVVAARWNADSRASAEFMETLYARLSAGDSPAAAVRAAAGEIRRQGATSHPYFWAQFSVYGQV